MVRVRGIDHVVLNVADVERSMAWYRDRLGLQPLRYEQWKRGEAPFLSMRLSDTSIIDLVAADRTGENVDHVALWVEGPLEDLVASGQFDVVRGPMDIFGAQGQGPGLYVRDPDGNLVELKSYPS
jgi:catechol 2,3-dioxygenase-like lactoylglutathione lyase family enzyme